MASEVISVSYHENPSILPQEVGVVSILLVFAPPSTLSASSSSKLNEFLIPDPFNRPRAVFLLEVNRIKGLESIAQDNALFSKSSWDANFIGSDKVDIQLPGENDASVFSLDEQLEYFTDKEIREFSSLIGGSYAPDAVEPVNGVLTIPLANGALVNVHMSKKVERMFVIGCFDGIKVLQEQGEAEGIAQHGVELLLVSLTKIFGSLQEAYKGQIVGIIFCQTATPQESGKTFNVIFSPSDYHKVRMLEEANALNTTFAEVALVRITLAWITGILLLCFNSYGDMLPLVYANHKGHTSLL
ncbi:hypothetical protein KIW84_021758 [Lathyrus oleraceus]|uniref:DUF7794 domain-containing protein n=1 Tax=Pisum sativum TaxID=3888 RepID=A0A9D4Y9U5_PEA|nr:hypothetical protein KIW84_021758 [Pisum sativum]